MELTTQTRAAHNSPCVSGGWVLARPLSGLTWVPLNCCTLLGDLEKPVEPSLGPRGTLSTGTIQSLVRKPFSTVRWARHTHSLRSQLVGGAGICWAYTCTWHRASPHSITHRADWAAAPKQGYDIPEQLGLCRGVGQPRQPGWGGGGGDRAQPMERNHGGLPGRSISGAPAAFMEHLLRALVWISEALFLRLQ